MKKGSRLFAVPVLSGPALGVFSEGRVAICAAAAVLIVLIVALLILALRNVGPIYEQGKTTKKFRLAPIRDTRKSTANRQK